MKPKQPDPLQLKSSTQKQTYDFCNEFELDKGELVEISWTIDEKATELPLFNSNPFQKPNADNLHLVIVMD
jgi:hypothetical protein